MTYVTGTITDANPGPALYAVLEPILLAAGYTLVDTVVIAPRTHKILKSPSTNLIGKEWYLDVAFTTSGAGTWSILTFENYDPATDLAYRGPTTQSNNQVLEGTYFTVTGATGYSLESSTWYPNAATNTSGTRSVAIPIVSSAFGYWISATVDRVLILTSNNPSTILYAGTYEVSATHAAVAGTDAFPLVQGKVGTGEGASINRYPKIFGTGMNTPSFAQQGTYYALQLLPFPGIPSDFTMAYPRTALRIPITTAADAGHYSHWGYLRDVAVVRANTSVARGDTVTIAGATWICSTYLGASPSYAVLLKAV